MKKIIIILLTLFLIFIIAIGVFLKSLKNDTVVEIKEYKLTTILDKSMEPEIKAKELIIIKPFPEYNLDDIITYTDNSGKFVTHRITQIDEYSFFAKGDNNDYADDNMEIGNIQGKVVFHSRLLGILYNLI